MDTSATSNQQAACLATLAASDLNGDGALDYTEYLKRFAYAVHQQCSLNLSMDAKYYAQFQRLSCLVCDYMEGNEATCSCKDESNTSGNDQDGPMILVSRDHFIDQYSLNLCEQFQEHVDATCGPLDLDFLNENAKEVTGNVGESQKPSQSMVLTVVAIMVGLVVMGIVVLYYFCRFYNMSQHNIKAGDCSEKRGQGAGEACSETTGEEDDPIPLEPYFSHEGGPPHHSSSLLSTLEEVELGLALDLRAVANDGNNTHQYGGHRDTSSDGEYFSTVEGDDDSSTQSHPIDIFEADDDNSETAASSMLHSFHSRLAEQDATIDESAWKEFQLTSSSQYQDREEDHVNLYKLWSATSQRGNLGGVMKRQRSLKSLTAGGAAAKARKQGVQSKAAAGSSAGKQLPQKVVRLDI